MSNPINPTYALRAMRISRSSKARSVLARSVLGSVAAATLMVGCVSTVPESATPIEAAEHATNAQATILRGSTPVTQSIDLYEAMARALKHNLDHRVAMMELDLAAREYDVSEWDMLPQVVASGAYYGRDNSPGASSISLLSGRQSLEPSTSTERDVLTGDLTATWNLLDFGLAKIRSEQLGNETMIASERRRKVIIEIMEDVHRAYYRAVSAERLANRLDNLEGDVKQAFSNSRAQFASRRTAPMPALSYQRELNDIQIQAQRLSRDLTVARMELASLMGLSPEQRFNLSMPTSQLRPTPLAMGYEEMVGLALQQRPEMRENIYAQRIGAAEIEKAVLEAFPSLEGFVGLDVSTNDFLFNQNWADYGARVSWNLIKVFQTPARKRRAQARAELERTRGLATAMAVMTQVGVARTRYQSLMEEYESANNGAVVQNDILNQIEAQARASTTSQQTLVRERMNAILAEARRDAVMADMAEAAAHIYSAMGFDPYTADLRGDEDVSTTAASLKALWLERAQVPGR